MPEVPPNISALCPGKNLLRALFLICCLVLTGDMFLSDSSDDNGSCNRGECAYIIFVALYHFGLFVVHIVIQGIQ